MVIGPLWCHKGAMIPLQVSFTLWDHIQIGVRMPRAVTFSLALQRRKVGSIEDRHMVIDETLRRRQKLQLCVWNKIQSLFKNKMFQWPRGVAQHSNCASDQGNKMWAKLFQYRTKKQEFGGRMKLHEGQKTRNPLEQNSQLANNWFVLWCQILIWCFLDDMSFHLQSPLLLPEWSDF